jgi:hypothetical protein
MAPAMRTKIGFRLFSCLPTALGCHFWGNGDFETSQFFGQLLVKATWLDR